MGKSLADNFAVARSTFKEVDDALGDKLTATMWEGPAETLTLTENTQPALLAVSIAALRVLESEAGLDLKRNVAFVAGHSLGEYSAHAAAGSLALADAAKAIAAEAAQGEVCDTANDNAPGQIVVSGHKTAVERAVAIAKDKGSRAMMLTVSAPFHCALMQPAADVMAEALAKAAIRVPTVPVVANFSAQPVNDPAEILRLLVSQVTGTVRWRESIGYLAANGVTRVVEVGTGKVLTGLMKRIAKEVATANVGTADDVAAFKAAT
jgi:[acyl-carrier-protein] S-malonyltransferase